MAQPELRSTTASVSRQRAVARLLEEVGAADRVLFDVVVRRFHGGSTIEDGGETLAISPATVKRRWAPACDLSRARGEGGV